MSVGLTQIWGDLGPDERLAILIEHQTAGLRRMVMRPTLDDVAKARLAGYASAIADVRYYVVEGNPLP